MTIKWTERRTVTMTAWQGDDGLAKNDGSRVLADRHCVLFQAAGRPVVKVMPDSVHDASRARAEALLSPHSACLLKALEAAILEQQRLAANDGWTASKDA